MSVVRIVQRCIREPTQPLPEAIACISVAFRLEQREIRRKYFEEWRDRLRNLPVVSVRADLVTI